MTAPIAVLDESTIQRIVRDAVREEIGAALAAVVAARPEPDVALMTQAQVAEFLQTDVRSLQRLILEGVIPPGVKIGERRLRWSRSTIDAAIARLERESIAGQGSTLTRSRPGSSVSGVKAIPGAAP